MKQCRQIQPLDIEESLTPWNNDDHFSQTPRHSRVKTNPYATKYYKKRNHSQSIKTADKFSKRENTSQIDSYKHFFDQNFKSYEKKSQEEPSQFRKGPNIFVKTMNITFNIVTEEDQASSEKNLMKTDHFSVRNPISCRSARRPIKNRIHATPISTPLLDSRKTPKQEGFQLTNYKTTKESVARSHSNFFHSAFKRSNSSKRALPTDRVADMLKLLKSTAGDKKEGQKSKFMKKTERTHLKEFLQGRRVCIF